MSDVIDVLANSHTAPYDVRKLTTKNNDYVGFVITLCVMYICYMEYVGTNQTSLKLKKDEKGKK
jgi:hypothetical protein